VTQNSVNVILTVSRALHNSYLQKFMRPTQHTKNIQIDSECKLIIACDGVWDVMTDQEAANSIQSLTNPLVAANCLRDISLRKFSNGNVSVIVVFFDLA
jgi:serine/threonine protein phosphatase PrpC